MGVVRFVTFEGKAAPIPDRQIDQIKELLVQDIELEAVSGIIEPGTKVEVRFGSLQGIEGEMVEHAGKRK